MSLSSCTGCIGLIEIFRCKGCCKPISHYKPQKGGSRKGSGAKSKYGEPTTTRAFRIPVSKVEEIRLLVNAKLSEWYSL